ncbi:MAG: PCMD domain-containing protein [Bacteroidales bacterium]|nr:PCMD domain-containing protein [Bacteroidales bacterium]MDY5441785.1 PCMD domain-containing protein [Candidatus Cryptobacteroides sp.]MDY5570112.1 PCMD domain-containing protein [Candidatus Cryptobacteroides sp.]
MKKTFAIISIAAAALVSCQKQQIAPEGEGCLSLSVSTDGTKAAMTSDELLANADIRIYKDDFSGMVRHYRYSEIPQKIYLPAGGYRIDVLAGEAAKETPSYASWEQKSYKGSKSATITAGGSESITVVAAMNSIVSNISFDESVDTYFQAGYTCTVSLSTVDGASLSYTKAESGTDGYFIASGFEPSLDWTFSGTLASGEAFSKSGSIAAVEGGKRYRLALKYVEKNGLLDVDILVDDALNEVYDDIIFVPVSTGLASTGKYEVWGTKFTAYADVDENEYDRTKVYFEYRVTGSDAAWSRSVAATRISEGSYSALINGLAGETEYEYRLVVTKAADGSEEIVDGTMTVTTEATPQVPNGSFETVSHDESGNYYSFYDPASSDPALQSKWWCSGNKGSTTVGSSYQITYPDTGDKQDGNQSVCLESRYVIVKFAAGNLFCGRFGATIGTSGGTVYFGRPFTARPTAMRFWAKYSSGKINRVGNGPAGVQSGDYDKASLRIALGTWDYKKYGGDANSPILVNTTDESTFVDYATDESTIAFGERILTADADNSTNVWQQITIPLDYKTTTAYPTHIMIAFAASMYGDYFTGCDSSKLWIDKVELLYE